MKKRRLNVLFVAIIALAAAPQALQDARRLVHAAQDRAESEFWSVFLSYRTAGEQAKGATELVADRRSVAMTNCPFERIAARALDATRASQTNIIREIRRASAKARAAASQTVEPDSKDETVARVFSARTVEFSEVEKRINPHARDAEKLADSSNRTTMASFLPDNENMKIRVKQALDKILQQKVRNTGDGNNSDEDNEDAPGDTGSM